MVGSGVLYGIIFVRGWLISNGLLEARAIGTLATTANDAFRVFLVRLPIILPIV
jgi:hypothetical protein